MDVFYRQYNTYRILLSILGLWPYHKSIYSTIHRISISVIMLAYIVFQVLSLFKAGITFRGCIVTLSAICPVLAILMRYVSSVALFPVTKYLFDHLRTLETMLKDQFEVHILMNYVDYCSSIIAIFLCMKTFSILTSFVSTKTFGCKDIIVLLNHPLLILGLCCSWILFAASYVFTPITLDLLLPLNESRRRYFSYLIFAHDRIEYVDIVCVNILVVYTIGLFCLAGTELMSAVFAHWMCAMFEITRYECYRLRKTIADLSSSRQIDANFRGFRHVVDCHRSTLQLVHLTIMSGRYYMMVSNALTDAKDEKEIFICICSLIGHLTFLYLSCYSGQLIIDRSLNVFKESYNSTWYCMPVEAQNLLLFIMLRSSTESVISIFGLIVASHVGISKRLEISLDEEQIVMIIIVEIRILCIEEPLQTIIVITSMYVLLPKADVPHITTT
ncbi:uncharacterized protein [Bombus flavifrons]|uniref:uncharacterized protein n=1 Tax=Bombus flavifrons TaxID=103934 RepID=UPI003704CEA8